MRTTHQQHRLCLAWRRCRRGEYVTQFDPGRLTARQWVIHEIPHAYRTGARSVLETSQAPSPFDADVARFFERKISGSLSRGAQEIVPVQDAEVPRLILRHLSADGDLVAVSSELARRLYDAQVGSMSGGLLVTVTADHDDDPVLIVLKLEKEEGARANQSQVDGRATLTVEYMRELFLTGRTRVFKVAAFREVTGDLSGWVSDPQVQGTGIARFFLEDFLGCQLAEDPQLTTQQFHQSAEEYVNKQVSDPATRARYETALVAELQNNRSSVDVPAFAEQHLDRQHRQPFVAHLRDAGVARQFPKNLDLIKNRLRRLQYTFRGGVRVTAPSDAADSDLLSIEGLPDGRSHLEVTDTLDEITTRG